MILISIYIPIVVYGLETVWKKLFPRLNESTFRHLRKALETGNAEIFVKEVKRLEDIKIRYNQKSNNEEIFQFCNAYLLLLTNNINEAEKILKSLQITIRKRFALRGEVDLL